MEATDFVLNLFLTALAYLIVPIIIVITKKRYAKPTLKKIVIINGAVIWLFFRIVEIELDNGTTSGASVLLWSAIAYQILKRKCMQEDNTPEKTIHKQKNEVPVKSEEDTTNYRDIFYWDEDGKLKRRKPDVSNKNEPVSKDGWNVQGSDLLIAKRHSYCVNCGEKVEPGENFCSICGHPVKK